MKQITIHEGKRYILYILSAIILMLIAYFSLSIPRLQVRIIYALGQKTESVDYILYDMGNGFEDATKVEGIISLKETAARRMFDTFFDIPAAYNKPKGIELKLQAKKEDEDSKIQIRAIEILNQHISMIKYSPMEIKSLFIFENSGNVYVQDDRLCIEDSGNGYAILKARDAFISDYFASTRVPAELVRNLLFTMVLLCVIAIAADMMVLYTVRLYKKDNSEKKAKTIFGFHNQFGIIMVIAFGCVLTMAFFSKHYAHPDEDVTRLAIDYYMSHWLPPDIHDISVLGTFSDYGMTRLTEYNLYYLAAGKIGWIFATFFHVNKYYRMLNVILFGIMVAMLVIKKNKNLWMIIGIGITPQLWYLFSYATSDAWDFFWGFLVIYELLEKESALQKFLENRSTHPVISVLLISFIFSMLFRGKPNYYLLLLLAFLVLLIKCVKNKENKLQILIKYMIIASSSVMLILPRAGIQYYNEVIFQSSQIQGIIKEGQLQDITPTVSMNVTSRKNQGYSFLDVFLKDGKDIISGLTNSGVGSYGWLEYHDSYWYGFGITGLYGIVGLLILYEMRRSRKQKHLIDMGIFILMPIITYLMVVFNCWNADFQAQGRYALPLTLVVGYYSMYEEKIYQNKWLRILLFLLGCISLRSYIGNGLFFLI